MLPLWISKFWTKKKELQKKSISKLLKLFPNYWVLVDKFIENSMFLAGSSDLMIKYIIDDFLYSNLEIDKIDKWKDEVRKNIIVKKIKNILK